MQFKRDIEKLKQVQRRDIRMVRDLETIPYQEWYIFHFQKRRLK